MLPNNFSLKEDIMRSIQWLVVIQLLFMTSAFEIAPDMFSISTLSL